MDASTEKKVQDEPAGIKRDYKIGDLLWAKIGNYPYWPCMISYDPYEGKFSKVARVKNREENIYHVQYFGKQVQHGWSKPGNILIYEGEEKFYEKQRCLMAAATNLTFKKKVESKFSVSSAFLKSWQIAVKEAENALPYEPLQRFELFVFKYEFKNSVPSNVGIASLKRPANFKGNPNKLRKIRRTYRDKEKNGKLCRLCEELGANVTCAGDCFQSFHKECLGILSAPEDFKCLNCDLGMHSCVICHKTEVSLTKCLKCPNCYHKDCLKNYECANIEKNICPAHICLTCYNENPRNVSNKGSLTHCFRCANVFHSRESCLPVGCEKLAPSVIKCPDHYLGKNKVSPQPSVNVSYCSICSEGGDLVCCEACPTSYHVKCLGIEVPSGDFFCDDCPKRNYLYTGMIVWAKTGTYRWWPAEIVPEDQLPENITHLLQYDGEFPVCYFGTNEYFWTHRGRVIPYVEHHKDVKSFGSKPNSLTLQYKLSLEEAVEGYDLFIQNRLTERTFCSKPDAYKHIRVNKAVPPAQITVLDSRSVLPCSCDPAKPNPCGNDNMCLNRSMLMECHPDVCRAKDQCENQKFQKRQYALVKYTKTIGRGWGLVSRELIKKGSFVIEYVGEIITHEEYRKREAKMRENNIQNYYFLHLDSRRLIDAGPKGNLARFINHSCNPNCEMVKWSVNGDVRIGIFTLTEVQPGEELTFHYHSNSIQFEQKCNCGSSNCEGFIGRIKKNIKKKLYV